MKHFCDREDPKLSRLRQELFLTAARHFCDVGGFSTQVQSQVLPKFGFRGDLKGVFDMLDRACCA